uniref:Ampulexin 3 n=1 Tax=Ampulex compressa TaxID=860918 RepID=AMPU3_AMPCP|nr:RecName: Full=Ampulexin 3; Short=Axn3; Flags: Precursor [Ampulex compressa]ARK19784.1 ampulexin 3 [Ampulex compressa]AUX80733.1 ampulexin 3 [Ampulex compressa]
MKAIMVLFYVMTLTIIGSFSMLLQKAKERQ